MMLGDQIVTRSFYLETMGLWMGIMCVWWDYSLVVTSIDYLGVEEAFCFGYCFYAYGGSKQIDVHDYLLSICSQLRCFAYNISMQSMQSMCCSHVNSNEVLFWITFATSSNSTFLLQVVHKDLAYKSRHFLDQFFNDINVNLHNKINYSKRLSSRFEGKSMYMKIDLPY